MVKFDGPFPHLVEDGFFSPPIYRRLMAMLPERHAMQPQGEQTFGLSGADFFALSPAHAELWLEMEREIFSGMDRIADELRAEIAGTWTSMFSGFVPQLSDCYQAFQLLDRKSGFEIEPHLDGAECVLTMLIYLPLASASEADGLELYEAAHSYDAHYAMCARAPKGATFTVAKRIGYAPNRMVGFANSARAFHGNAVFSSERRVFIQCHRRLMPDVHKRLYAPLGSKLSKYPEVFINHPEFFELWAPRRSLVGRIRNKLTGFLSR